MGLGLIGNFAEKNNLREIQLIESNFRSIESNFQSIETCRFSSIILQSLDSNFTNKHILSSLNLNSMF